jgi:starvation-inducible DNA-binding protein
VKLQDLSIKQGTGHVKRGNGGIMEKLVDNMKIVLADTFAFYLKAHNFHWNVEGSNFPQYHEFLGNLYQELHGAVDPIAEHIRALNAYAPGSLTRFRELSSISDSMTPPTVSVMFDQLRNDNEIVLLSLKRAYSSAEEMMEIGLSNFIQDRYDIHKKHAWMLKSIVS